MKMFTWVLRLIGIGLVFWAISICMSMLLYMAKTGPHYNFWHVSLWMLIAIVVNFFGQMGIATANAIEKVIRESNRAWT